MLPARVAFAVPAVTVVPFDPVDNYFYVLSTPSVFFCGACALLNFWFRKSEVQWEEGGSRAAEVAVALWSSG